MDPKVKQIISNVFGSDDNGDEDYLSIEPPFLKRKASAKNDISSDLPNLAAVAAKRSRKASPSASEDSSSSRSLDKPGSNSASTAKASESEEVGDNSEERNIPESSPALTDDEPESAAGATVELDRKMSKKKPKKKGKIVKSESKNRKMEASGEVFCGNDSGVKKLPDKDKTGSDDEEEKHGDSERHSIKKGSVKKRSISKNKSTKLKLTSSGDTSVCSSGDKKFSNENQDQMSHESSDNECSTLADPKRKKRKKKAIKQKEIAKDEIPTREVISSDSSDPAPSDDGSSVSSNSLSKTTIDERVSKESPLGSTEHATEDSSKSHSSCNASKAETATVVQAGSSEARSSDASGSSSSDSDADDEGVAAERGATLQSKSVSDKKRLKESGNQIKEKADTKKSKSSVESSTNSKITNRLVKLRRLAKTAGLFIMNAMRGCKDDKEKLRKLEEFLAGHGLAGSKLTLEYCKKFRIKREAQQELESLDRNNIVHSSGSGRPKRQHGFSLYRKGYLDSLSGGSSDVRDSTSRAQRASDSSNSGSDEEAVKMPFSRLRDIIDSDGSSD